MLLGYICLPLISDLRQYAPGCLDRRADALTHLTSILSTMSSEMLPLVFVLENVKPFRKRFHKASCPFGSTSAY